MNPALTSETMLLEGIWALKFEVNYEDTSLDVPAGFVAQRFMNIPIVVMLHDGTRIKKLTSVEVFKKKTGRQSFIKAYCLIQL